MHANLLVRAAVVLLFAVTPLTPTLAQFDTGGMFQQLLRDAERQNRRIEQRPYQRPPRSQAEAYREIPNRGGSSNALYAIDGVALGDKVNRSPQYADYRCSPSTAFPGLTWCQRKRDLAGANGPFSSHHSMLHAATGEAVYLNQFVEPAFFRDHEIRTEPVERAAAATAMTVLRILHPHP
jgi:hypothetical protein